MPQTSPFGTWKSPITSERLTQSSIRLIELFGAGKSSDDVYFIESRPSEAGRYAIVRLNQGKQSDLTDAKFNARTRVHEYGGASAVAGSSGRVIFSNFADQRLYEVHNGQTRGPITQEKFRFADFVIDEARNALFAVREDHSTDAKEPRNEIVQVDLASGDMKVLATGFDFYSSPRLSPDGQKLAYVSWNHPEMPWTKTELHIVSLVDGSDTKIAGNGNEAIAQPQWSPDGSLYFISDRSEGWWNIHRVADAASGAAQVVLARPGEFCSPAWVFGNSNYQFIDANKIICSWHEKGEGHLAIVDVASGKVDKELKTGFSSHEDLVYVAKTNTLFFIGMSSVRPTAVCSIDLSSGQVQVYKQAFSVDDIDAGHLSAPREIEFPTADGKVAYGYYYAPKNKDFVAPEGEKPPCIVKIHGGPTASASTALRLELQYWTNRGFAIFDVDYRGSTGHGREYRMLLNGAWGIADVEDCVNGAKYLAEQGLADAKRCCISGGSAGGFTVLAALAFKDFFAAGTSHYGVADLELLASDTHKFEARYLDGLIGPYPAAKQTYIERSPIHSVNSIKAPLALLQGDEDKIVPPNQALAMYDAVKKNGVPVHLTMYSGEQHGWRKAETIKNALETEFKFYAQVFGFKPADDIPVVQIDNWKQ